MGVSQVFIFIMVAITFSVILIFGFKAITDFLENAERVEFVQFKLKLESSVKEIYSNFGARSTETYHLPARYKRICFINLDYPKTPGEIQELCALDPIACTAWENSRNYEEGDVNVFLSPHTQGSEVKIKVYRISMVEKGYLCEDIAKGKFSLILDGKGDRTELTTFS